MAESEVGRVSAAIQSRSEECDLQAVSRCRGVELLSVLVQTGLDSDGICCLMVGYGSASDQALRGRSSGNHTG